MNTKPHVGQIVYLNEHGMKTIRGLDSFDMIEQSKRMIITKVDEMVPNQVWGIFVDQPLIDQFMISNFDVDPVE